MGGSLGEQIAVILGLHPFAPGAWFLVENEKLLLDGVRWAPKDGGHPVMLLIVSGPNATVVPRSATVPGGLDHERHPIRHEPTCKITRFGRVKSRTFFTLQSDLLGESRFSCYEPQGSEILKEFGIGL